MKRTAFLLLLFPFFIQAQNSAFFRDWYQSGNLSHYLDNLNPYVCFEQETTGEFDLGDRMIFSISGNSYQWNRFYLDGVRIDSRFMPGSTVFRPDLYQHDLYLNPYNSSLYFQSAQTRSNQVGFRWNMGGLGGISPGTKQLINLFHQTATERLYHEIPYRSKINQAADFQLGLNFHDAKNKAYYQELEVRYAQRSLTTFDRNGINGLQTEPQYFIQLHGQLPTWERLFDKAGYALHFQKRNDLYSEFYFNDNETAHYQSESILLQGNRQRHGNRLSSGIQLASHHVSHREREFVRNLVDQDGEGFEPWYPDGTTNEFSHSLQGEYSLGESFQLQFDCYNSLLCFQPEINSFNNAVYAQMVDAPGQPTMAFPLYIYHWRAQAFQTGLLDNVVRLQYAKVLSRSVDLELQADACFDALLLNHLQLVSPNWQAMSRLNIKPTDWFRMEIVLARQRVAYNYDQACFLSDDYLNGDIYYWMDHNGDLRLDKNEEGDFFRSTGGRLHQVDRHLKPMSYALIDLPVHFQFGGHRISFLQTFRKYYNVWHTGYAGNPEQFGEYADASSLLNNGDTKQEMFFLKDGQDLSYLVSNQYPDGIMGDNYLTNSPFYASSIIQYEFQNRKNRFSIAWQSYMEAGISSLGNGPLHNNIGVLSESTANPNTHHSTLNSKSPYQAVGRLNQDKAYVLWIFYSRRINNHLSFALNGKFRDGQPFCGFDAGFLSDSKGQNQCAVRPYRTKGINPLDNDFGSRKDAFFNLDLRLTYRHSIGNHPCEWQLSGYNLYDFGTELTEYTFFDGIGDNRNAMSLCIPRGMILSMRLGF